MLTSPIFTYHPDDCTACQGRDYQAGEWDHEYTPEARPLPEDDAMWEDQ